MLLQGENEEPTLALACYAPGWTDPDTSLPIGGAVLGWRPDPDQPGLRREYNDLWPEVFGREVPAVTADVDPVADDMLDVRQRGGPSRTRQDSC